MEAVSVPFHGRERRVLLARPTGPGPFPLVLFLHGTGGTAAWADQETGWSALARRESFLLAVPEALPPDPSRPPKFLTNPPRWNDGSTRPGTELYSSADDVGFLEAVVEDAIRRHGADPRQVCLSGFSNGAGMAFRFASEQANRIAALAPVAGHCWIDPKPARPIPTLYLIGTADPLVPLDGGPVRLPWNHHRADRPAVNMTLAKWAGAIGCEAVPEVIAERPGLREVSFPRRTGGAEFQALFIDGLGHHWPGGRGQLNPKIGGPPSNLLNANETIWSFFRKQALA